MDFIANELKSLRMPGMAQCWLSLQETRQADALSFSDGLQLLLQVVIEQFDRLTDHLPKCGKRPTET
jgi:hypothetical protein